MEALVDEAVEGTFPASDPPSYMAGAGILGAPSHDGFVREASIAEITSSKGENVEADRRTRERAYFLWEQEGRPEGRADDHWHAAEREEKS